MSATGGYQPPVAADTMKSRSSKVRHLLADLRSCLLHPAPGQASIAAQGVGAGSRAARWTWQGARRIGSQTVRDPPQRLEIWRTLPLVS